MSNSAILAMEAEISGARSAHQWLHRVAAKYALATGPKARLVQRAIDISTKIRDAAGLLVSAGRVDWDTVAWAEQCPDGIGAPVWAMGRLIVLVHEILELDEDVDRDTATDYRQQIDGLRILAASMPIEDKVEVEAELRGERAIDRRIQGPEPVLRKRRGKAGRLTPCIRV